MDTKAALVTILAGVFLLVGCGTAKKVGRATSDLVTGGPNATPEWKWNGERTWKRIGESPPTYVPAAYTKSSTDNGQWYTDKRDGKRLFVPRGGVKGTPESVLRAEAWKATGKKGSGGQTREGWPISDSRSGRASSPRV